MAKLHVVQADRGESFLLKCGCPRNYILIDGGYKKTFKDHLQNVFKKEQIQRLDLVIASHVDNDHIGGLLTMLKNQREGSDLLPHGLWHNTFDKEIEDRIKHKLDQLRTSFSHEASVQQFIDKELIGIKEGNQLKERAESLGIPINDSFPEKKVQIQELPKSDIGKKNIFFYIIGPTKENLEQLENEWDKWNESCKKGRIDPSSFNKSSIMVLVKVVEGNVPKSILFTGDGSSNDILEGLERTNLLEEGGILSVHVLKVPHHGSLHNVNKAFFTRIIADNYVISGKGDDHPAENTLKWIIESASSDEREIQIFVTNENNAVKKIKKEFPKWKSRIRNIEEGDNSVSVPF